MKSILLFIIIFLFQIIASPDNRKKASKARAEGDALLVSGDAIGAVNKYAQAIELEPKEVKNYLKSYRANERLKRTQACIRDLTNAIENDEQHKELQNSLILRANIYSSLGRCHDSFHDWSRIVTINPKMLEAIENRDRAAKCVELLDLAEKLSEANDWHGVDQALTEAIDSSKTGAPEIKRKRARARYHKGDHYECIADAGEVVKHDRNDVEILTLRGQAYFELGDMEMALRHSQEALQSDPDFAQARDLHKMINGIKRLNSKGLELMQKGKWMEAVEYFEQALNTWEIPAEIAKTIFLNVCKCAGQLKDRSWVVRSCSRSFEFDENWVESRIRYAELLSENSETTEEWEETVRAWNKALEMDRQNGHIHDGLKKAEAALKQSKTKNYYKILGVLRHADIGAIKKAYRDLAKQFHPDRHQGLTEEELKTMEKKFADIAEAYEVLSDPEKRGKYDRGEDVFENQGRQSNPFQHQRGGFHWNFNF